MGIEEKDFQALKDRVAELERRLDSPPASADPSVPAAAVKSHREHAKRHDRVRKHLDDGNLDKAGEEAGIERAHGGDEPEESYKRRLQAHVDGAEKAKATVPRKEDGGDLEGGETSLTEPEYPTNFNPDMGEGVPAGQGDALQPRVNKAVVEAPAGQPLATATPPDGASPGQGIPV